MDYPPSPYSADEFQKAKAVQIEDEHLKSKIRRLRLLSRILAFALSIAVFVPITLTLHKFLTTKDIYHEVVLPSGQTVTRTAWAKNSKTWPTWMYFLIAGIALLLNLIIIIAYLFGGVKHANRAAYLTTTFTTIVMLGNVGVWIAAATLYRTEKDKNGKSNDLWGWTCSPAAQAIQKEFVAEVDFERFCNVQSVSWYIGLVQAGSALLTIVIWVLVLMRNKSKKRVMKQTRFSVSR
ncbi:hypothetical protein B0J11DRAFT_450246 [Dendryphion nanum]|uniref:Uncharacterized protein n=1 Tax=Dendryphion nanum TaxID=256645 RepID=A0A9P9EJG7_9PLEO|nr:hypothetical protein B0J11DRAFT_450246 [Dendryphion nanum]